MGEDVREPAIPANTTIPKATTVSDVCVDCGQKIKIGEYYRSQRFGQLPGKSRQRSHIGCRPNDEVSAWVAELGVEQASAVFRKANR
jgi:hypothetical protein